jgi:DNA-binding SARP family transcriptional activator
LLLLHAGKRLERDHIAEQLWPMRPPGKARRNLSTTLWRLRQTLECHRLPAEDYLLISRDVLAFDAVAPYWFDVEAFERRATFGLAGSLPCDKAHCLALEEASNLYRGDLLEGCYADWCVAKRERVRLLLLRVLRRLQHHYRLCGAFEAAISSGHRLLALDPLQEGVHRELMRCYVETGQRALAVAQFRQCGEILRQELRIEPMAATQQLYQWVRGGPEPPLLQGMGGDDRASLQAALTQLQRALGALESAWQTLQALVVEFGEESEPS